MTCFAGHRILTLTALYFAGYQCVNNTPGCTGVINFTSFGDVTIYSLRVTWGIVNRGSPSVLAIPSYTWLVSKLAINFRSAAIIFAFCKYFALAFTSPLCSSREGHEDTTRKAYWLLIATRVWNLHQLNRLLFSEVGFQHQLRMTSRNWGHHLLLQWKRMTTRSILKQWWKLRDDGHLNSA